MKKNIQKGFTLIELLIVIAILGVLATVVLVAINPLQNLAKTRDAGRLNTVGQLGHALEAYATTNSGIYVPSGSTTWMATLVTAGEINVAPGQITNSLSAYCTPVGSNQNGICYTATTPATGVGPVVVYSRLEALSNTGTAKCGVSTQWAYAVYSSADGQAGIVCTAASAVPVPGNQTFK